MATILCYNFDPKAMNTLQVLALRCGAVRRPVKKEEYGLPLEALLGAASEAAAVEKSGDFRDRMLVMCDLGSRKEDQFLQALRAAKLSAGVLKAVLTETNRHWSSVKLHQELCAEREAISAGKKAIHKTE